MTLADLIKEFRTQANDKVEPFFWSEEEVAGYLNLAQQEAAIRGRLILEVADPDICKISVTAGDELYKLNDLIYELSYLSFKKTGGIKSENLRLVSGEYLDDLCGPSWRDRSGNPVYAIQADKWIRLVPKPERDGTISIEGYRRPVTMPLDDAETVEPEINEAHHPYLVDWALHKAFSIPDTEAFDPERSAKSEQAFTDYFGQRPDSDLRRITREDVPHHVKGFWV